MGAGFAFPHRIYDSVGAPFHLIDSGRPTLGLPASGRRTRGAAQKRRISKSSAFAGAPNRGASAEAQCGTASRAARDLPSAASAAQDGGSSRNGATRVHPIGAPAAFAAGKGTMFPRQPLLWGRGDFRLLFSLLILAAQKRRITKPAPWGRVLLILSKNRFAGFFSTVRLRPAGRFRRFFAKNRRVKVFFPGTCPRKNIYEKKSVRCTDFFDKLSKTRPMGAGFAFFPTKTLFLWGPKSFHRLRTSRAITFAGMARSTESPSSRHRSYTAYT